MKIKKGDTVLVTRGKDKGHRGAVLKSLMTSEKVLVEGANQFKKHIKRNATGQASEIVTITKPLPVSVVALICPNCKKKTRVGYSIEKDIKVRICKKCGKKI